MVIFGAGASYDSAQAFRLPPPPSGGQQNFGTPTPAPSDGGPWRPPLVNDLFLDRHHSFGQIVQKYPRLTHILPLLRERSNGRSVEEVLESLLDEGHGNPERQREFASVRYYLCDLLTEVTKNWHSQTDGATNYAPLVGDILRFNKSNEPVCLVTFNYDLLLEHALYSFDFKRRLLNEHFDSHPVLKLFKLHGSIDWARLVDLPRGTRLAPQHLIGMADSLKLSDEFVLANPTVPYEMYNSDQPIFPAIAIPVQTKTQETFECPRSHLAYLQTVLESVTKILIIGWQARKAHFIQLLRSHLSKLQHIMVVSGNSADAKNILDYFIQQIGPKAAGVSGHLKPGGFTDFVVNRQGDEFLRA